MHWTEELAQWIEKGISRVLLVLLMAGILTGALGFGVGFLVGNVMH